MRVRMSEIINGKRDVTPDTAIRLGRALQTSPQVWLNLQQSVDLYNATMGDGDAQSIQPLDGLAA